MWKRRRAVSLREYTGFKKCAVHIQTCAPLNASRDTVDQVTCDKRNLARYAFTFTDRIRVREKDKNRV